MGGGSRNTIPFFLLPPYNNDMLSINNIEVSSKNELNLYISDEDIYKYYLGDFEDNTWFSSPWRVDPKPSLKISYYKNNWVWVDYGEDPRPKDSINFVEKLYNISYNAALQKVYKDIYLNTNYEKSIISSVKIEKKSFCKIRSNFHSWELDYWKKVDILEKDLKYWNIYSGEIRYDGRLWHKSIEKDPLFIYMFDKTVPIYKGYRPYANDSLLKFFCKNTAGHIQGWDKLPPTGDILIITKSYKDVLIWWKLGYPAIAPHSENMFISPFDVYDLQSRFKNIYVNYDNDATGVKKCIEYTNEYGLKYFNLPISTNCKDPFQFVVCNNYDDLNNLFLEKLKRDGNKI